MKKICKINFW